VLLPSPSITVAISLFSLFIRSDCRLFSRPFSLCVNLPRWECHFHFCPLNTREYSHNHGILRGHLFYFSLLLCFCPIVPPVALVLVGHQSLAPFFFDLYCAHPLVDLSNFPIRSVDTVMSENRQYVACCFFSTPPLFSTYLLRW